MCATLNIYVCENSTYSPSTNRKTKTSIENMFINSDYYSSCFYEKAHNFST